MQKVVIPLDALYRDYERELRDLTDQQLELVIFLMNSAYCIGCIKK